MTSMHWMLFVWFWASMAVLSVFLFGGAWFLVPLALELSSGIAMTAVLRRPKAIEPVKIDGRTHSEWYDLIKGMGREEFERLRRPALDGLEDSAEGIGGWDVKRLLGNELYKQLQKDFYPERVCKHCNTLDCKETCPRALEAKASKRKLDPVFRSVSSGATYYVSNGTDDWRYTQPVKKVVDVLSSNLIEDPVTKEPLGLVEKVKWSDGSIEWKMASDAAFKARVKTDQEAEKRKQARNRTLNDKDIEAAMDRYMKDLDRQMRQLDDMTLKWEREARSLAPGLERKRKQHGYYLD